MDELHRKAHLLALHGRPVADIAVQLGVEPLVAQLLLDEAVQESLSRPPLRRMRNSEREEPVPELFRTRDGLVIALVGVPADEAEGTWRRLEQEATVSGVWPVIFPDRGGLAISRDPLLRLIEDSTSGWKPPLARLLALADSLDPDQVLRSGWDDSYPMEDETEPVFDAFSEEIPAEPVEPITAELVPDNGTATIALVPCSSSAEIPAVLGWGGWNACPPPEEHVVILRRWKQRYNARLQAMSPDTLEFHVGNPPLTFDDAVILAKEQYSYSGDIIYQENHPTIGALAVALLESPRWHFWWD